MASSSSNGTLFALTVVILAPVFELLPEAVLGAILIYIMITGLVDVPELLRIYRLNRIEFTTAVLTLLTVLSFGTLEGVIVGATCCAVSEYKRRMNGLLAECLSCEGMDLRMLTCPPRSRICSTSSLSRSASTSPSSGRTPIPS